MSIGQITGLPDYRITDKRFRSCCFTPSLALPQPRELLHQQEHQRELPAGEEENDLDRVMGLYGSANERYW